MQTVEIALTPAAPSRHTVVVIGQPSAADLALLAQNGARFVLDLRQPSEDRGFDEAAAALQLGIGYRNLPIAGAAGLTRESVREFARLVNDPANHPLVVHCATANRVGALTALKAVWHDGLDHETALALGRRAGMTSIEDGVRSLLMKDERPDPVS